MIVQRIGTPVVLATVLALASGAPAQALDLTVGLGAAYAPDYEGSDDYTLLPAWSLRADDLYHPDTYVRVLGTSISSNLLPDENFRVGLVARYLPDYDKVDDSRVEDLERPQEALQTGVLLGYDALPGPREDAAFEVEATYDLLHGNGGLVTPRVRYKAPLGQSFVGEALVQTSYASEDYMSNRFGVSGRDARRSGLERFNADDGLKDLTLGGQLSWIVTENWLVTGLAGYTRLLEDAEDSPIVADRGDQDQLYGGLLVNYRF
ncbi:MipA/OmpV family protein [Geminicoccaceae bacterium 1502E]|nr:MipA/OmpV family protein [Geminicoccaceae bacterium 1502E]